MSPNATRIAKWLRPLILPADIVKNPPADHIVVRHVNVSEKTSPVSDLQVSADTPDSLRSLAEEIDQTIADDATGLGSGLQRYLITAVRGDDEKVVGRLTVRARGADDDKDGDDKDALTEPATARGMVGQAMRHVEAFARIAMAGSERTITSLERQNAQLQTIVENALEKQLEAVKLVEDLMSEKNKRDVKMLEAQGKVETRAMFAKQIMPLLATIAKKFTGDANGAAKDASTNQLRALVASLSPEQVESIASSLSPPQQVALQDLMTTLGGDEETETDGGAMPQ